jgi:hypothetical protein
MEVLLEQLPLQLLGLVEQLVLVLMHLQQGEVVQV